MFFEIVFVVELGIFAEQNAGKSRNRLPLDLVSLIVVLGALMSSTWQQQYWPRSTDDGLVEHRIRRSTWLGRRHEVAL
jgi:hypothetical protein